MSAPAMPSPLAAPLTTFLLGQLDKHALGPLKLAWDKTKVSAAAQSYLVRYQDAYGQLKPLGIAEPIPLGKIYTEVQLTTQDLRQHFSAKGLEQSARADMRKLLDRDQLRTMDGVAAANDYQRLMVLGHPGGGKSTYLRRIGWECLRSYGILKHEHSGSPRYVHTLLPILLELKSCRSDETRPLIELLAEELRLCGFPDSVTMVQLLAKRGRLLILLDALDEVASSRIDAVMKQANDMVREYPDCRFIISCRIAFSQRNFANFTDVTLLEFTDTQIDSFIGNWFSSPQQRADEIAATFVQRLHEPHHAPTLELARSPVLLGLLCLAYQSDLALPSNRAEVYRTALDALLKRWNAEQQKMGHTEQVHASLPHDQELAMLAEIAHSAMQQQRFFLTHDEWLAGIRSYFADLVEKPKALDAAKILDLIALRQGLVVQRTPTHWSFSHLTLQEYLAAEHIVRNDLIDATIQQHLRHTHWQEVFLIIAGMRPDKMLLKMVQVAKENVLLDEPVWSHWEEHLRSLGLNQTEKEVALKAILAAIYVTLDYARVRGFDYARVRELNFARVRSRALALAVELNFDRSLSPTLDSDRAIDVALALAKYWREQTGPSAIADAVDFVIPRILVLNTHEQRNSLAIRFGAMDFPPFAHPLTKPNEVAAYFDSLALIVRCKSSAPGLRARTWEQVLEQML